MSISKLKIENFKCFEKVEISLKNLTLLTGQNSAGKTTIIQAILFQLQSGEKPGGDMLNGKFVSLGKMTDVKNCYTRGQIHGEILSSESIKEQKNHIMYLTTNRIGPQIDFKQNPNEDNSIDIHGEYAFSYLSRNRMNPIPEEGFIYNDEYGKNFGNQVDYWLEYLCGYSVIAEEIEGTTTVKVSFQTEDRVKNYRSVDVGTGVTYLAVLIISALSCTPKDILIIENPELYLHPAAQSKFMEFFSFLARNGLQVIIETHSDHIINGLRKEVKKKHLTPHEVSLIYVQKNNNISFVDEIRVKESGAIENPMKGFFDQIDDDLDILLGWSNE